MIMWGKHCIETQTILFGCRGLFDLCDLIHLEEFAKNDPALPEVEGADVEVGNGIVNIPTWASHNVGSGSIAIIAFCECAC